jgi:hypothetical protein
MAVDSRSANWRLFGGGGLVLGGLLWFLGVVLTAIGAGPMGAWLSIVGVLVVGVALFLVAFGQTGSNGAVGASVFGKVALVAFGIGWILFDFIALLATLTIAGPDVLLYVAVALVIGGGVLAAIAIFRRGVARGIARWVIAVPVAWGVVWAIHALGWVSLIDPAILAGVLAALYAVTGLLYLLNRKQ